VEAATGFEPVHKGFADLSLTTWVRRRKTNKDESVSVSTHLILFQMERVAGFEPVTPTLARLCSTTELHPQSEYVRHYLINKPFRYNTY
jgi:hypothetical protein